MATRNELQDLRKKLLELTKEHNRSVPKGPTKKLLEMSSQIRVVADEIEKLEKVR